MIDLASDELLQHLESWHPDPETWHGSSHEGQGRELTTAISLRPDLLDGQADKAVALRPTYLRAILRGWDVAYGGERLLPWATVVAVIQQTAALPDESPFNSEGRGHDDDLDYLPAKAAAVRLLATIVEKPEAELGPPESTVVALAPTILSLVNDPKLQTDYVTNPVDGMDPLMISINRTLPIAVRALVALLRWSGLGAPDGPIIKALDELLERNDPHGAIATVFGASLALLDTHAPLGSKQMLHEFSEVRAAKT
jgi:hypothetical protein